MKKRQLVQTYGRHRQRVVSVDVWSSPANSVFSSSNDSFLSQSGTNTSISGNSNSSRGLTQRNRKDENVSWLQGNKNANATKNNQHTRKSKKYLDDTSCSLQNNEEKENVNEKSRHALCVQKSTGKKKDSKPVQYSVKKVTTRGGGRKTRNTMVNQAKDQMTKNKMAHTTMAGQKEASHNFSDFENYDLVVESPQLDRTSPEVCEDIGGVVERLVVVSSEGAALTSTPHRQDSTDRVLRSQRRRSALTSTPHSFSRGGRLHSGISTRPHTRRTNNNSLLLHASISGQQSFSDLETHPEEEEEEVDECIAHMDHLHLSGMSSIAASPAVSCNMQTTTGVNTITPARDTTAHSQQAALKQCTVSLQKLRTKNLRGYNTKTTQATDLSNEASPLRSHDLNLSFTPSTRITRPTSKVHPVDSESGPRNSVLHSCIEYSDDNICRGRSTCTDSHSDEHFYSCSSSALSRGLLSKVKNSTYTVEPGSLSHSYRDPSQDLFDSVAHSSCSVHCCSNTTGCDAMLGIHNSGLTSIQEVSQRLQQMSVYKDNQVDGQKVIQSECKGMAGHNNSGGSSSRSSSNGTVQTNPVTESVSLYTLTSEEELSDIEEGNEGQGPEFAGEKSLYTLPSDEEDEEEELSVITEEEEADRNHSGNDETYNDSHSDSESETSESETEEIDSNESETEQTESNESEENVDQVLSVAWSDDDSVYLSASQSEPLGESVAGKSSSSHVVHNSSNKMLSSYNKNPNKTAENSSLQVKQLHQCCASLKALTPVRCRKSGHTLSARHKVLLKCNQTEPLSFTQAISPSMLKKCVKIGEGVYGEVFKADRNKQSVALKIVPIEGDFEVNDEPQKTFAEMLPEIVISKELCALKDTEENMTPNFVEVKRVSVVEGVFPPQLLRQWDLFHKKKGSENDRPDMFDEDQLFIIFEFEECGCDLEAFKFSSLEQAKSVLLQVTCAFAVAETALQFEHRDLHWGNVLVKETKLDTLTYTLAGEDFEVETCGVKVAIIDFTLSRLCKDGCEVFCDLSTDPTLFIGEGDYQFEVYRLMKEENENEWKQFHPYTNVLWIHYLADKLLKSKSYRDVTIREHSLLSRQFRNFLRDALDYQSALHLLKDCCFFDES